MGVYIKGMEMPTSCYYCPFADGTWGYSPPHKKRCLISGKDMPVDERNVQHDPLVCPLVPVPSHGRLIDADELRWCYDNSGVADDVISKENYDQLKVAVAVVRQTIDDAPTIIEAEEGE